MALFLLGAGLAALQQPVALGQLQATELEKGISQVREGEFEAAVITLDGVVARLAGQPGRATELARAHIYLAAAYIGLDQEQKARDQFVEAWEADNDLKLSSSEFPPSFIASYERAREARKEKTRQGKGSKLPLLLGGGAAIAGGVAVAATRGGDHDGPVPGGGGATPAPTPLSSSVVSIYVRSGNSFEVDYLSAQPPPGSTVPGYAAASAFSTTFSAQLVVRNPSSVDATRCNAWLTLQKDDGQCAQLTLAARFDLGAGEATQIALAAPNPRGYDCATPVDISSMTVSTKCKTGPEADWGFSGWYGGAERTWSIYYRILP